MSLPLGPIPARAGESRRLKRRLTGVRAYPRSRGGIDSKGKTLKSSQGLSPLARGNHAQHKQDRMVFGPIPARAGESL